MSQLEKYLLFVWIWGNKLKILTVLKQHNQMDFQRECIEAQVALLALWGAGGRGCHMHGEKWRLITLEDGKGLLPGKQCQGFMLKASKLQMSFYLKGSLMDSAVAASMCSFILYFY